MQPDLECHEVGGLYPNHLCGDIEWLRPMMSATLAPCHSGSIQLCSYWRAIAND
jgi:hypothetical protein